MDLLSNRKERPGYKIVLSDEEFQVLGTSSAMDAVYNLSGYEERKYIIILDDSDYEYSTVSKHFFKVIVNSYFIFMTRNEGISGLNYGVSDVLEMVPVRGYNTLIKSFTYNANFNKIDRIPSDTVIVCEDSKSGFTFYSNLFFNHKVTPVVDVNGNVTGKDGLLDMLERLDSLGVRCTFVLADWCSFGMYVARLSAYISTRSDSSLVMLPSALSLEYVLLNTNIIGGVSLDGILAAESEERFYEEQLANATRNTPYYQSHGAALKECYYKPCCVVSQEGYTCAKRFSGKDKFVSLLKGTPFECLLKLSGRM